MTSDDRRANGPRREEDLITARLDDHIDRFDEHLAHFERFEQNANEQWAELMDVLEGPQVKHLDGTVVRTGGVLDQINQIDKRLSNGGIKIKIPAGAWIAIVVAVIAGLFQIGTALVGG